MQPIGKNWHFLEKSAFMRASLPYRLQQAKPKELCAVVHMPRECSF
jgi:hypothetical protein